jgi:hypothetical protein
MVAEGTAEVLDGGHLHPFRRLLQAVADRCKEGGPEVVERLIGNRAAILAQYEPTLASIPGYTAGSELATLPPEHTRRRALIALAETIDRFASDAPLLLILDDVQWADELSLSFLDSFGVEFWRTRPIVVLCLYRSEEASETLRGLVRRNEPGDNLRLEAVDPDAIASMVSDMLAMPRPPESLVRYLAGQSEGNPFFAAEYMRLLAAERILERRNGTWTLRQDAADGAAYDRLQAPHSIQELVGRRLGNLLPTEREVIEAAAVLGREFRDDILATVTGIDEALLATTLRDLTARQILEELMPASHRFAHDKLRSIAFDGIQPDQRRNLHLACGRALEADASAHSEQRDAELAYHFKHAGERMKAIEHLEKAAQHALSTFANRQAESMFRELLAQDLGETTAESDFRRAVWERGLGDSLHGLGRLSRESDLVEADDSCEHLEKALALLGHPVPKRKGRLIGAVTAEFAVQVGHRLWSRESTGSGGREQKRSLEATRAYDRLLQIYYYNNRRLEMFLATLRTLNLAERVGPSPELAAAYAIAHAVAGVIPSRSLADAYFNRANEILRQTPDPAVHSYLLLLSGVYRSGIADWRRARADLDQGLAIAESLSFHRRCDEIRHAFGFWHFLHGDLSDAVTLADKRHLASGRDDPQAKVWQLLMRAQVYLARNASADALQVAREAEALAVEWSEPRDRRLYVAKLPWAETLWMFSMLAASSLATGSEAEAEWAAKEALKQIRERDSPTFYCVDAYSRVCDVLLSLWDRRRRQHAPVDDLPGQSADACRYLNRFARVFPAAVPRSLIYQGNLAALQAHPARARSLWQRAAIEAEKFQLERDATSARSKLAGAP